MSTVTTIVVAGVSYCEYTRVSVVIPVSTVIPVSSSITIVWHNIQKHNYYYMYVLYINNVSVILHRI